MGFLPGKDFMKTTKILTEDIARLRVSSLPTRPSAPAAFGGRGYTAAQLKEAFDRLPLYIVERFNSLLDDVVALGDGSLAAAIPTGIGDGHTLAQLFCDVGDGNLATYMLVGDKSLAVLLSELESRIGELEARV